MVRECVAVSSQCVVTAFSVALPQVEFYFGDMNLRNGFLRLRVDESEDGCK